jgi:hypothetical protein
MGDIQEALAVPAAVESQDPLDFPHHPDGLKLFTVLYYHRHGSNAYAVKCHRCPTQDEVIDALGIDWEPEQDEVLEINVASPPPVLQAAGTIGPAPCP